MNFTIERPYAFYALILLLPAILIIFFKYKKICKKADFFQPNYTLSLHKVKKHDFLFRVIFLRTFLRILSFICLVCAFAGFSWGTYLEPVQKNGTAVSMVFDISYSMMAKDCPDSKTRLETAVNYAKLLLEKMENQNISVLLAKGEGEVILPLTEDRESVESLLDSLSPKLMSSVGTSLGGGVLAALQKFPSKSSLSNRIWLFTDGEETDGKLQSALEECFNLGVNVFIIGFGAETETQVLAGDGKTKIFTALRSENLEKMCKSIAEKNVSSKNDVKIEFIDSTEPGSALKILKSLKKSVKNTKSEISEDITYEVKPVKRYSIFIVLAIIFFILSFIFSELNVDFFRRKNISVLMIFSVFLFSSCTSHFEGAKTILFSSWAWNQNQYNKAVSGFFKTVEESNQEKDFILNQYALYNLAVTYSAQNENKVALERFSMISENAPDDLKFATFYDMGVIFHQQGEYKKAAECFKESLKIKSDDTNAKNNYELSLLKFENQAKNKENTYHAVSESEQKNSAKENSVFNVIREYEKQQWKNNESIQNSNLSQDY